MKRYVWLVLVLGMAACVPPRPPVLPPVPPAPSVRTVAVVVQQPAGVVVGAACSLEDIPGFGPHNGTTNGGGYVAWDGVSTTLRNTAVHCKADGYLPLDVSALLKTAENENLDPVTMQPAVPPLPQVPTRAHVLQARLTFQGLTVQTAQFGTLPWFEAALPWLGPADRHAAYAAKHASTAWPGGDTHCLIFLPSGTALYDEPGQPYSADLFGSLDWTAGNTRIAPAFSSLVAEVIRNGFTPLIFLGGDDGERGYVVATTQLPLVVEALRHSPDGDLTPYVVILPGFDGVFYGYTPAHIHQFGIDFRALCPTCYLGLEHGTGHIPAGEGPQEWWAPDGPMRPYDLLLSEFDDGRFDDTVWQISGRMLGPAYRRPPDQPQGDDPSPPFYLRDATDRGPIVNCAFEFYEYTWVRGAAVARVNAARDYFKSIGHTCGG